MKKRELHFGWHFRCLDVADYPRLQLTAPPWLPAVVPGNVHLDLVTNRVISDPFTGMHELGCQWVDHARWVYQTEFDWKPDADHPSRVLRFEGLDTVCCVFLNNALIAKHDNMFLPLEVEVSDRLEPGKNQIRIEFDSAVEVGLARRRDYFEQEKLDWGTNCFDERAFVRKAQYMSGWDWGPRLVSCGIFGSVSLLEFRARMSVASVRQEKLANGNFRVWTETEVEGDAQLQIFINNEKLGESGEVELAPYLWWPANEGAQTLSLADFVLSTGHSVQKNFGLRTIRLIRENDEFGKSFGFEVNGRPIFARGANWIPDHSFPARFDPKSITERIGKLPQIGFNMLRVWGGGLYESEEFYDACDRSGILVWQDFPYACMHYPDDEAAQNSAYEEASFHVRRLRDRACLALWCGNNENEQMWIGNWGGDTNPPRYFGEKLYSETLANAVKDHDGVTDYIRTSPIGLHAEDPEVSTNPDRFGDSHVWTAWHGTGDWHVYAESQTRFCSEYGFASSPSMEVWNTILEQNEAGPDHPTVRWHDKTGKGKNFKEYVEMFYPQAESLEDWVYYSQLNQRDAMRFGVESFRRSPLCQGSLIWQFNDCWPAQSWALEDHGGLLKPAGHELARTYASIMLSVFVVAGQAQIWAINDSDKEVSRIVEVDIVDVFSGTREPERLPIILEPGEKRQIRGLSIAEKDPKRTALCARFVDLPSSARWEFLAPPKEMMLMEPQVSVSQEGLELIVKVQGFAADLIIWDDENATNLLSPISGWPGWSAMTLLDEEVSLRFNSSPNHLRAKSLIGNHDIHVH